MKKKFYSSTAWLENIKDKEYYQSYVENCEANDEMPGDMESDAFLQYAIEDCNNLLEDEMANLECSKKLEGKWLIFGTIGRWNGNFSMLPQVVNSITEALRKCFADDIDIEYDKKGIYVAAHHHDATNHFQIRQLTRKAENAFYEDEDKFIEKLGCYSDDLLAGKHKSLFNPIPEYLY